MSTSHNEPKEETKSPYQCDRCRDSGCRKCVTQYNSTHQEYIDIFCPEE